MIPLDAAGFIRGDYFAPAATGLTQLRLVTEGGDDGGAVLGMVTALAYLRGDPTALCPDTPVTEMTQCGVPIGAVLSAVFGEYATLDDFDTWSYTAGDADAVYVYLDTSGATVWTTDSGNTFNGVPSVSLTPFWAQTLRSGPYDPVVDLTVMIRLGLPLFEAIPQFGGQFGFLLVDLYSYYNYCAMGILNDRLVVEYQASSGPSVVTTVDIGPSSLVLDRDIELIGRWTALDALTARVRFYACAPCGTPELLWESDAIPSLSGGAYGLEGASCDGCDFHESYGEGSTIPETGALIMYQWAMDTDPTVFGIPA